MQQTGMASRLMMNVEASPQEYPDHFLGFKNGQFPRHPAAED